MAEKKNGRPTSYSREQVIQGIEDVEKQGGRPTGDTVKKAMCARDGSLEGINAQSLNAHVVDLLTDRESERIERLVTLLPDATRTAAANLGARFTAELTNHMAEEFDRLRSAAGKKLVEKDEDLRNQRDQIRELQSRLEEKDINIEDLELANLELKQQLATAKAEISELAGQVSNLRKAEDLETMVLAAVTKALDTKVQPAA